MPEIDLHDTIADSVDEALLPEEPQDVVAEEAPEVEAAPEAPVETETPTEVASPAKAEEEAPPQDEFEKKYGIPAQSATGRENRIPYSRVKKITEKAIKDAQADWEKSREGKYIPADKFTALETENKGYKERLSQVGQFENLMVNDHVGFLNLLATRIPGYAQLLAPLYDQGQQQAPVQEAPVPDDMPQPDQQLSDGSMVYSLDGLKALMKWQGEQVRQQTVREIESRYAPLEQDYRVYQQTQAVLPQVQRQIAEARTWPMFNENEADITRALQQNPAWNLERAYQAVVLPKLQAQQAQAQTDEKTLREKIRAEVLGELKKAPKATAVPAAGVKTPQAVSGAGPRSLESVIESALKESGLR